MTEQTVKTALGEVTLRRPTEKEALAKMQKRLDIQAGKFPVDADDDGDEEVLDCITSPVRAQVEEWLEEAPRLMEVLDNAFDEIAGGVEKVLPGDLAELSQELREKHGRRLVAVKHDGQLFGLTRIGRTEFKLVKRRQDYMLALAQLGRGHVVHGSIDATAWPTLAAQLGTHLLQLANRAVEADLGKSPPSSVKSPAPTS